MKIKQKKGLAITGITLDLNSREAIAISDLNFKFHETMDATLNLFSGYVNKDRNIDVEEARLILDDLSEQSTILFRIIDAMTVGIEDSKIIIENLLKSADIHMNTEDSEYNAPVVSKLGGKQV